MRFFQRLFEHRGSLFYLSLAVQSFLYFCLSLLFAVHSYAQSSDEGVFLVVDGMSTGASYVDILNAQGYRAIHLHSSQPEMEYLARTHKADKYLSNYMLKRGFSYEQFVESVQVQYPNILGVFSGTETAVSIVSSLGVDLQLPGNDEEKENAWRSKYEMQRAIAELGINHMETGLVRNKEAALKWMAEHGVSFPVIIKPDSSAGGDGFSIVYEASEFEEAISEVVDNRNIFGKKNYTALIQEKIVGNEYAVNGTILDGVPYVSDIWAYRKNEVKRRKVYDHDVLLNPETEAYKYTVLNNYVAKVLKALGMKEGTFHAEVILQKGGGSPVLVEVAARPMGGSNHKLVKECIGMNQVELAVLAQTNPKRYKEITQRGPYKLRKEAMLVEGITASSGRVLATPVKDLLNEKTLPTLFHVNWGMHVGDVVAETSNLLTETAEFLLTTPLGDHDSLKRDYRQIRKAERGGIVFAPCELDLAS